jgi:hypothetical protein
VTLMLEWAFPTALTDSSNYVWLLRVGIAYT